MNEAFTDRSLPGLTPSRRRSTECLSDLALDAFMLGELDRSSTEKAHAHLASCVACDQAFALRRSETAAFEARPQFSARLAALTTARPSPAPSFWQTLWPRRLGWVTGLAAAATALIVALPAQQENRVKGGFSLSTFVQKRGATTGTLWMQEPVSPGDKIQFQVTSDAPGYLAVLSVDAANTVSLYYPPGPIAVPIKAGSNQPLQTAVALDEVLGEETVIALRCATAEKTADLAELAQRAVATASKAGHKTLAPLGTGCVEHRLTLTKVP